MRWLVICMTNDELNRIEALPKEMLVPTDIAKYLGCSAYTINVATRDGKNPFPFPVIRMGTRVRCVANKRKDKSYGK